MSLFQRDFHVELENLGFVNNNKLLDKSKSLDSQVKNEDLIYISRESNISVKWKNNKKIVKCNTNLSFYTLRDIICEAYLFPKIDWNKYSLKAKGQFIFLEALIPFDGISDEIEVVDMQGSFFKCTQL